MPTNHYQQRTKRFLVEQKNFRDCRQRSRNASLKLGVGEKDLSRAALEAIALEGYRSDRLTGFQVMEMLGLDTRLELDAFLKAHHVHLEYSLEDLERERADLDFLPKE